MSQSVILVTAADLAPEAAALLRDFKLVFAGKTPSEADIVSLCREHNPVAIIVRYSKVGAAAMDAAPALRVISKHGSGTDTIDKAAAAQRGVQVVAAAGANAAAVAEHALALLLACAKSVVSLDARMRAGHWDKSTHKSLELDGKTIGLVGLGAIGRRMAAMAQGLNMRVIGFDPYAKDLPGDIESGPLEAIWREADVISLHCPLTDENRGMVNAANLARCKPGVILVNTARGGLIDENALLQAVRSGQVGAAGLDSFAVEPMTAGHPFHEEARILLSPHIGGVTREAYVNMGVAAARNALDVLARAAASA
ncbi:NAD(P)-dependent oxidoreductase [Bordetella pseudohinzii]|uniref:3-phosphoglycerate dehydrogenase n=1 Tax=Bordetella pseudohinzii TaxID=1331258 RepID=A0A0J6C221_9BORD|nr:NAD(P)-dependent oxidoreductase [Bordetella pseudohinzii]ANY17740.1 3-phosphoglycerate dehydrogenase [Bordetella pseudohinzii]KMM24821.1 3-phosphoglycerate dehydrogenase [Bordetella pseudohinzii]KXA77920.1 3-phosphoglycerate dehydrogenase [Bordetella pseudohinzii]KXA79659.1 3-phosphoglycerate dehydrogenase [Bordetella pseudohinzii]CUJ02533.1 D-3-phosphoglycerate dehydrogenase [Bordetella pseudohinzii]